VVFCVVSCNYKEEPALAQRAANSIVKGLHHIRISSFLLLLWLNCPGTVLKVSQRKQNSPSGVPVHKNLKNGN